MAEVAASIIAISTFGVKLTLTLYDLGSTVSSARQQTDQIAKHVTLYSNVLELLAERLEADAPNISEAAIDLVEELYDQSDELFGRIRALLPRKNGRDDLRLLQKIAWTFKKTKVDLLVGELEYLKSTVQLLVTVIFTGKRIRTYRSVAVPELCLFFSHKVTEDAEGKWVRGNATWLVMQWSSSASKLKQPSLSTLKPPISCLRFNRPMTSLMLWLLKLTPARTMTISRPST